jgi:hypothetical protein
MDISFMWEGQGELHTALYRPIQRAGLTLLVGRPSVLFLWHPDGTCLRIANQMHDLADWLEVGSLVFGDVGPTAPAEREVEIGADPLHVEKLILVEDNTRIESGIAIQLTATRELIVLPGEYPYSLAVQGLWGDRSAVFEPEYPVSRYQREQISR